MIRLSIIVFLIQNEEKKRAICSRRAGWDSNPRFAAPQAAVLVLARLPAPEEAVFVPLIMGSIVELTILSVIYLPPSGNNFICRPNVGWIRHVHLHEVSEARVSNDATVRNETFSGVCRMRSIVCCRLYRREEVSDRSRGPEPTPYMELEERTVGHGKERIGI